MVLLQSDSVKLGAISSVAGHPNAARLLDLNLPMDASQFRANASRSAHPRQASGTAFMADIYATNLVELVAKGTPVPAVSAIFFTDSTPPRRQGSVQFTDVLFTTFHSVFESPSGEERIHFAFAFGTIETVRSAH